MSPKWLEYTVLEGNRAEFIVLINNNNNSKI